MARTGRPKAELVLTDDECETLTRWARRRTSSQALALRCRIVLESATGASNKDVAARLGVEAHTVSRWRARFVRDRLEGLTDEPRPGGPSVCAQPYIGRAWMNDTEYRSSQPRGPEPAGSRRAGPADALR
jgi:DNA-binding CsgD family transcriptional regulator